MKIWIAAIGSRPREGFEELARLYLERIAPLLRATGGKGVVEAPVFRTEEALWEAIERERTRTSPLVVLLDERGKPMGSEEFAQWLGRERDEGRQLVIFAIGPGDGWPQASRTRGNKLLSLGPMTMAHELARVVICEQVYRALTILHGHPYHRAGSRD
jgi:23S rRNA (pseudouridine1915-N3)-methyltransferase